jgi:Tfp pilus assembly protein PilF
MLNTVNNLGLLYAKQGKMVEAEKMYLGALEGKEKAWGPEHTLTLTNQGKMVEAEKMYLRALRGGVWGRSSNIAANRAQF